MGFDVELDQDRRPGATPTPDASSTPGKRTTEPEPTPTETTRPATDPTTKIDPETRIRELVGQLEKQFARRPEHAKQIATTLSAEFPALYPAEWLLGVFAQIDLARWKKARIDEAVRYWDDRPGAARGALQQLKAKFPRDAKLVKWCNQFLAKIEVFQLTLQAKNWDRPGDAKRALEQLRDRGVISKRDFAARDAQIWAYQDAKWAERVTADELRAWLGANVIEWDEAPDEVKRELQIRLGQLKRDQYFGDGGRGVRDTRPLANPTSDATRRLVLDRADDASATFEFSTPDQLPARRLELTAGAIDREATRTEAAITRPERSEGLFALQPDALTEIMNKTLADRAESLRKTSGAYRALAQRLRTKQTTLAAERALLQRDLGALDLAIFEQASALKRLEKSGDHDGASQLRRSIEALRQNRQQISGVLADPDGVVPGAGAIIKVLREPTPNAVTVVPAERVAVGRLTSAIDSVTSTPTGYERGIGRNVSEMLTGLVRLSGRVLAFEAGVMRLLADGASYVLPESLSGPLRGHAEQLGRVAFELKRAESSVTASNRYSRDVAAAEGYTIPLIDRVLSPEKIAENPDVALFTVLTALPQTKGVAFAAQLGVAGLQTAETFFSTYGLTGKLGDAATAAGWSALQNTAGMVLSRLGLGAAGEAVANVAVVFAFGKLRGLPRAQIEEEIAYALIGAGIGASVGAVRARPVEGVSAKATEIVAALEQGGEVAGATIETPAATKPRDPARAQKIDVTAVELQQAMIAAREITRRFQAAHQKQPTARIVTELETAARATKQKKAELAKLYAEERTQVVPDRPAAATSEPTPVAETETAPAVEAETTPSRDARFEDLFATNKPADSLSPELHFSALARRAAEARAKHPELAALSDAEIIALIGYTTADSVDINKGLRGQLGEGANAEAAIYADMIASALAKLPDQAGTFTRVVDYGPEILAQLVPGAVVADPGFSSTSRLSSAELADQSITGNTELVVHGKRGKRLDFLSKKPNEAEVLFAPNTAFRVESVTKVGDRTKVVLAEVEPTGSVVVLGRTAP